MMEISSLYVGNLNLFKKSSEILKILVILVNTHKKQY